MKNTYESSLIEDEEFYRQEILRMEQAREKQAAQSQAPAPLCSIGSSTCPPVVENVEPLDIAESIGRLELPHANKPDHFPAFMSRSALFSVSKGAAPAYAQFTEIPSQGSSIRLHGPRLTMRDKSIWEIAIQIAKEKSSDIAKPFEVSLREFVRRLGEKDTGGAGLESIWESLRRLCLARIEICVKGRSIGVGSMLATVVKREGRCFVRLNPDFAIPALTMDHQFRICSQRRNRVAMALGQWLHDFLSTHNASRDMDLAYLRKLCGYDGPKRNFAGKLNLALVDLQRQAPELLESFAIDKTARDSDKWILRISRGSELPQFIMPSTPRQSSQKRGGPAL